MYTVEIGSESADQLVVAILTESYESLRKDYFDRLNGKGYPIFDGDYNKDIKEIKKKLKALERVIEYFGGITDGV